MHTYSTEAARLTLAMADERPDIVELSREHGVTKKRRDVELYHKSRALNVTMQDYEDLILTTMEDFARANEWQFDVLIYDGGLLRRREGKTEANVRELMRAMEHEILCEIGIPIGLEIKEL